MKFTAVLLALAVSIAALPTENASGAVGCASCPPRFPSIPNNLTVQQAQDKCGDNTTLSCCDEANFSEDSATTSKGLLAGALSGLIGQDSDGLGIFKDCSKIGASVVDLANHCKTNVACCERDKVDGGESVVGVNIGCIALGSLV